MKVESWLSILEGVAAGNLSPEEALENLRTLPYEDLLGEQGDSFARLDHHRKIRTGIPEVVFGQGKTPGQVVAIVEGLVAREGRALVTRASPEVMEAVHRAFPQARCFDTPRAIVVGDFPEAPPQPYVAVLTGGTADLPVAEEAALTLEFLGRRAVRLFDVGVAGLHRLLDNLEQVRAARVVIVVAGMEGALVSVTGGLVDCPIIAVPTSVGYGASFEGLAPLLAMLNSCAPGVAVVNIDNGFGAGVFAHLILREKA